MASALSGSILQSITRNDLADPGIIGINSGAGVGIALFFLFLPVDTGVFTYVLPFVAFIGALITASLISLFPYEKHRGLQPIKFVLTEVGFLIAPSGLLVFRLPSSYLH